MSDSKKSLISSEVTETINNGNNFNSIASDTSYINTRNITARSMYKLVLLGDESVGRLSQ